MWFWEKCNDGEGEKIDKKERNNKKKLREAISSWQEMNLCLYKSGKYSYFVEMSWWRCARGVVHNQKWFVKTSFALMLVNSLPVHHITCAAILCLTIIIAIPKWIK